jgi:ADP-heptose:LPS heptosyltransferase
VGDRNPVVFDHLQIYDRRERWAVGCADAVLRGCATVARWWPARRVEGPPRRILLLRLERIGDLLMTLGALELVHARAPEAEIHLVVGRWNESLARLVPGLASVETLDAPWLAREPGGGMRVAALVRRVRGWRVRRFDLAVNFEPDIRSNLLLALSGAPLRVGYGSGGGGALLTRALTYVPSAHTADNAARLVDAALPGYASPAPFARLRVPEDARRRAGEVLEAAPPGRTLIGIHPGGGRPVKQWPLDRFAEVAVRLARENHAVIVLTGSREDRSMVDRVEARLAPDVLAGLLERLAVLVTGDTGPMHLAAAVGTPVVAVFGPSDPARYGPLVDGARVVTADLWCRPCNRVRLPPARCAGRTPDCLGRIDVDRVHRATREVLAASGLSDPESSSLPG